MRRRHWVILALLASAVAVALGYALWQPQGEPPAFTLEQRPQADQLLFDYAGLLEHSREGTLKYLRNLTQQFHIEAVIVSLPDLGPAQDIQQLAVDIANRWEIGRNHEGRGLLLLLVNEDKQVKLEVNYELEDVFTDAFSGYVEDLQLKPYYLRNDLGTGLVAVMEALEQRAQLKRQGDYTPGLITRLDAELLAGGAGAKRQLGRYQETEPAAGVTAYDTADGAKTPREAWRIMLTKWAGKGTDIKADIYTEMTKLAMGDQNRPEARTRAALPQWQDAEVQVLSDDAHAVIYFGNRKGWNNAPFLFCKTPGGWKFDIVHQRRLIVMGSNPDWMVEQGNYPYVDLLDQVPHSTGKDLPLKPPDLYTCAQDREIAAEMHALQRRLETGPENFATVMALARLNIISGRRPSHVTPLIKRAKQLDPDSALPYKYSAIFNVNSFFQYETALQDIETYIEKQPEDVFGYNVRGFLHYRLGNYRKSIDALQQALELGADNVYALALMSRDYALLYSKANRLDPRRAGYRKQALAMLQQAETAPTQDIARVERLKRWLQGRKIL